MKASSAATPDAAGFYGGTTDTIYVTAPRATDVHFPLAPIIVTIVPLEETRGGADLAELLSRTAGLQMKRYGGLGAQAIPSIRGSSGAQVTVLVDGIPLANAQDGTIDLSSLPLERFSVAEVYRGSQPLRFGGSGGAGAINLVSRPAGAGETSVRLFTGSYGDVGGRFLHGLQSRDGSRSGVFLAHARRIDNRFEFLDHNQTLANPADDFRRARWNAQFEEWGGYGGGRWDGARLSSTAALGYFQREGGRPGPLGFESPHATFRTTRADGRVSLASWNEAWRLDVMAVQNRQWLHDEAGEVGFDPPGTTRSVSNDLSGRLTCTNDTARDIFLASGWHWRIGADWRRQWYDEALNSDEDPQRVRTTVTAFGSLRWNLPGPCLAITPAVRWRRAVDNFPPLPALPWLPEQPLSEPRAMQYTSPSLSAVWAAVPDRLYLETHGMRSVRLPTWVELFGHRGGIAGNRELEPEDIATGDIAVRWQIPGGRMHHRLALFHTRTENTIIFVQNSQRTSMATNFGTTETTGLEWESAYKLPAGGSMTANLTWQAARDRGDEAAYSGKEVPFLPPLELAVQAERPLGAWTLSGKLFHEAPNFRERYNIELERAPARTIVNLALSHTWHTGQHGIGGAVTVTAEVINLTGNDVYDVEGFPLPGRSLRLSAYVR